MRLNLSSQIVLNKVPVEFYKPKTTVEYSEISRMEKIHTDIFASMAEGASHVADKIEAGIKAAQQEGKFYVMALGSGSSRCNGERVHRIQNREKNRHPAPSHRICLPAVQP